MTDLPDNMDANPCLGCGACCAFFRCSFYWGECDDVTPGGVPAGMTVNLGPFRRAMKGTNQEEPYCIALVGQIGAAAHCGIYRQRSSTCRRFVPSYANGSPNEECDRARARFGLAPLTPEDWNVTPFCPNRPKRPPKRRRRVA